MYPPRMELSSEQLRILGVLIEKKATTPDQYPLTLNSIRLACNQKTSRHPVVDYDEGTVRRAVQELQGLGMVRKSAESTARATRYDHGLEAKLLVGKKELAVLAVLMLRGPQTVSEIRSRSQRIYSFASVSDLEDLLGRMEGLETPLVELLGKQPGEKEVRFRHMLSSEIPSPESDAYRESLSANTLEKRVAELEQRVAELEELVKTES